ncbi:MAG: ABC transporter ATP-binding protein [Christensenellales bacterium]|jgi:iron complex transport system ATP-binding protein
MIELIGVSAGYDGQDVLHGLDFALPEGQNLCILGPNGCGKTTLLRAIAGLLPFAGDIRIDGRSVKDMGRKRLAAKVALMSQVSGAFFGSYCVAETVAMGRYLHGKGGWFAGQRRQDRAAVADCLAATGLTDLADRPIGELSGGQLQRVFLARALAQQPSVILLDEPTNHLDLKYQTELIAYLKDWSAQPGHTVVGVLHDINLALELADQGLFLKDGRLAAAGPLDEVVTPALLRRVYDMDVAGYMRRALTRWEGFSDVPKPL